MNPFELAKAKRAEQIKEAEERQKEKQNQIFDKEDIKWCGLSKNPTSFRILGLPCEVRQNPTDVKRVFWSKIINDTNHWVNILWKTNEDVTKLDEEWILHRLYRKITESDWVDYTEKELELIKNKQMKKYPKGNDKGYFVPKYSKTISFERIDKNKKNGSNQFGHFYPKERILANVIDRMDDWCIHNKHSKILSGNHSPFEFINEKGEKKTIWFTDIGFPMGLYKIIYSQVLEFRSDWNIDIIVNKEEDGYNVRDAFEEKIKLDRKYIIQSPLTEEELKYERYDLDKLFPTSSYQKILKNLEKLFKQVDIDLNTKFFEELKNLAEDEKRTREKIKKEESKTQIQSTEIQSAEIKNGLKEVSLEKLPNWNSLDERDKESMRNNAISFDGEKFSYKTGVSVLPCDCKKYIFPEDVFACAMCGKKFEEATE